MDPESLLRSLNTNKVRYVVIGAMAASIYGLPRATADIDVLIEPTAANARRTLKALKEVGYDVTDVTVQNVLTTKLLIRQYILATDIHPSALGVTFANVWENRVVSKFGNEPANYASLDDIITMKRAAGRPKDLEDLRVLLRIKEKGGQSAGGNRA